MFGALAEKAGIGDRRQRALRAQRFQRHRASAEAHRRQARRRADRRRRRPRGAAAGHAATTRATRAASTRRTRWRPTTSSSWARKRSKERYSPPGPMLVIDDIADAESDQEGRDRLHRARTKSSSARGPRRSAPTPSMRACCCSGRFPMALKAAKPGTEAFRVALRDALEQQQRGRRLPGRVQHDARPTTTAWTSGRACWSSSRTAGSGFWRSDAPRRARDAAATGRRRAARRGQRLALRRRQAAGASSPTAGRWRSAALSALAAGGRRGHRRRASRRRCPGGRCFGRSGALVAVCADADEGMGASLACGVRDVQRRFRRAGRDHRARRHAVDLRRRRSRASRPRCGAAPSSPRPRIAGCAVIRSAFGARYFAELAALSGDEGAQSAAGGARRRRSQLIDVDDPGVLRDVDTPADLGR